MRSHAIASASLALLVLLAGCMPSGGSKTDTVNVPLPAERSADVTLVMRSGDIRLAGAAAGLLEGTLSYDGADPKPVVTSGSRESTVGKVVTVSVEQPPAAPVAGGAQRLWDLRMNGGLPTNLTVTDASGDLDLDLTLADPKNVDVTSASGSIKMALGGPHPSLSRIAVTGSSGDIRIDANGEYPALEGFVVKAASGDVMLDFSGTWRKSFTAEVGASSGNVTIVVPKDVNVRVVGKPASGSVTAEGFRQEGDDTWVLEPAKRSESTFVVNVRSASGNLTLQTPPAK